MHGGSDQIDPLSRIPSPSRRLWAGLAVILSTFGIFAAYTIYEVRWLEDFQVNVVQKNRKASLQLLRLQNDAYLLAISLRDMSLEGSRYTVGDWRAEFNRLREDVRQALELEAESAVSDPAVNDKRVQLRATLEDFWSAADHVFLLAQRGKEREARGLIQPELEGRRAVVSEIIARLLVLNDRAQAEATERVDAVYTRVKRDFIGFLVILFLIALGTGLYTFEANRKTFDRLHRLAERLQEQSEQLRRISWKLIEVQEETLRRVARDLHDEFGQVLTAIGAMLSRARQKGLDRESPFVEEVEKVKKIVEETLQNVRDSSQMFRPAILDDFGLEQTLDWFTGQFSRQTGIQVHFARRGSEGFFPAGDAIHVYRVVQEALSNVVRHAATREAWVNVNEGEGEFTVEIRDKGRGFDPAAGTEAAKRAGVGMMSMRERAEHLGGSLEVVSSPGAGTRVTLRVPLNQPAARPVTESVG